MMACTCTWKRRMSSLSMTASSARMVRFDAVMTRELVFLSAHSVAVLPASDSVATPPLALGVAPGAPGAPGMAGGGMGGMMEDMMGKMMGPAGCMGANCGAGAAKTPIYPSLMTLPALTPEKRAEIDALATQQISEGTARLAEPPPLPGMAARADVGTRSFPTPTWTSTLPSGDGDSRVWPSSGPHARYRLRFGYHLRARTMWTNAANPLCGLTIAIASRRCLNLTPRQTSGFRRKPEIP